MKTGHKFERDQGEGISERVWREETEERNDAVILQSQQKTFLKSSLCSTTHKSCDGYHIHLSLHTPVWGN